MIPKFATDLHCTANIALLVTPEYEGIFKNGGIGTYYATLGRNLAHRGRSVVLLLCQTADLFEGRSLPHINHVFSTADAEASLDLAPVHTAILSQFQPWQWVESDSYRALLFAQALSDRYPQAQLYIEFPDLCGLGYRTIQAKRAGLLGKNCAVAVTLHSGQEWLNEAHERFTLEHSNWFRTVYEYEQYAFENADMPFFLSDFLKAKVESYGWKTDRALHLPYGFPLVGTLEPPTAASPTPVPSHPNLKTPTKKPANIEVKRGSIPIVFFGRLEERKGLLTFLAAVRQLPPELRARLHFLFLGKSVPLHAPHLQSLTSRDYIDRQLGGDFTYDILSDLFSQEAIALVRDLASAIVCLSSPQENLPNSALEMGQLPVSLVVSDTGGFREPLNLIRREAGLYWFEPGNAASLAKALSEAISAEREVPTVPSREFLEGVNRSLLERRLALMERAFSTSTANLAAADTEEGNAIDNNLLNPQPKPKQPESHRKPVASASSLDAGDAESRVLGMTCTPEQSFLQRYAGEEYSGRGEMVDLGCWLGSATICLAKGLERNRQVTLKSKRIHAYDWFRWQSSYMERSVAGTDLAGKYQDGESFLDEFLRRTQPWSDSIEVCAGDLTQLKWNGGRIEYLFVDAMKTWKLAQNILKYFYPFLIPGVSLVHHNDFADSWSAWIHLLNYRMRSYFTHRCSLLNAAVFDCDRALPASLIEELANLELSLENFSKPEIDAAFADSMEIVAAEMRPNVAAAKAMLFLHLKDLELAEREYLEIRDRYGDVLEIPQVGECIEQWKQYL